MISVENNLDIQFVVFIEVIPLLAASAQTDRPAGASVGILEVLRQLMDHFGEALAPQHAVHKSINNLVLVSYPQIREYELKKTFHCRRCIEPFLTLVCPPSREISPISACR